VPGLRPELGLVVEQERLRRRAASSGSWTTLRPPINPSVGTWMLRRASSFPYDGTGSFIR